MFDASTSRPQAAVSMLKQDYKEGEMTLSSALALAVKVLNKTMDVSKLSAEKGEVRNIHTNKVPISDKGLLKQVELVDTQWSDLFTCADALFEH